MRPKILELTTFPRIPTTHIAGAALLLSIAACGPVHRQSRTNITTFTGIELPEKNQNSLDLSTVSPQVLFEAINQLDGLYISDPEISDNPQAPILLILQDKHGSPEIEKSKLERLLQLGINTVMIEGWAGHEADQQRGYQLFNAEQELISELLQDERFRVLPLEDRELQEKGLMSVWAEFYIEGFLLNEWLKACQAGELDDFAQKIYKIQELEHADITARVNGLTSKFNIKNDDEYRTFREKALSYAGTNQGTLKRQEGELWTDYENRINTIKTGVSKLANPFGGLLLEERNHAAAKLLFEHLKQEKTRISVVIFGAMHFAMGKEEKWDLISLFKKQGDCTVASVDRRQTE